MHLRKAPRGWVLLGVLTLTLFLAACGGSTSAGNPNFSNDPDNNPGLIGDLGGTQAVLSSVQPFVYTPQGVSDNAPLGTDPAYAVQPAAAAVISRGASKASAELGEGETYGIDGVTMALVGADPDFDATELTFNEGDKVVLWMRYEAEANAEFSRRWTIEAAGLDYLEPRIVAVTAGTFDAGFTFNLPYDMVPDGEPSTMAEMKVILGVAKTGSAVVGPGDLPGSVNFQVKSVVTDNTTIYPIYEDHAQMCWEDILEDATGRYPDYDYNDLVAMMWAREYRNINDELVQIDFEVKALARGAGWVSSWQFNMDAAFPEAQVVAIVDQFYANGTAHGDQRVWNSSGGASVPVFAPTLDALPKPPDHNFATNVVAGTTFIDGDYAKVTVVLDRPLAQGSYTPIPYEPELRVSTTINGEKISYAIGLWRQPGDDVDKNGRPLGFIVPDTFAWPLETKKIDTVYGGFVDWVYWINHPDSPEPSPVWYDKAPIKDYFRRSLFK